MTTASILSAVDLPLPGTKGAPKKFKGCFSEVEMFLHHYERLCKKYNVTADKEKVENITQYCSRNVREFMEGDRKSTRLNSSHSGESRMPSSA